MLTCCYYRPCWRWCQPPHLDIWYFYSQHHSLSPPILCSSQALYCWSVRRCEVMWWHSRGECWQSIIKFHFLNIFICQIFRVGMCSVCSVTGFVFTWIFTQPPHQPPAIFGLCLSFVIYDVKFHSKPQRYIGLSYWHQRLSEAQFISLCPLVELHGGWSDTPGPGST